MTKVLAAYIYLLSSIDMVYLPQYFARPHKVVQSLKNHALIPK